MEVIGSSPVSPTQLQYRWGVSRLCERPGCSALASVAYGFDTGSLIVWVGPLGDTQEFGVGQLCRRHADALVVPKGWRIDDRRESVPRLFSVKATHGEAAEAPRPTRSAGEKSTANPKSTVSPKTVADTPPELFDSPAAEAPQLEETRAIPWMPTFGDDDIDEPSQGDASSGLLSRAFGNKERRER